MRQISGEIREIKIEDLIPYHNYSYQTYMGKDWGRWIQLLSEQMMMRSMKSYVDIIESRIWM